MLKKFFVGLFCAICLGVFADSEISKINFRNPSIEEINVMKDYLKLTEYKTETDIIYAIQCEVAVYIYENKSVPLTIEVLENIAKKKSKKDWHVTYALSNYIYKAGLMKQFADQMTKIEKYTKTDAYVYCVSTNVIKPKNHYDIKIKYVKKLAKLKRNTALGTVIGVILNDCEQEPDDKAVEILKKVYRGIVPYMVENAEMKPFVIKIGLALRSYGVDVK